MTDKIVQGLRGRKGKMRIIILLGAALLGAVVVGQAVTPKKPQRPDPSAAFSDKPQDDELARHQLLPVVLTPTRGDKAVAENHDLSVALRSFAKRENGDDDTALSGFIQAHPKSRWNASLLVNLGMQYYSEGKFSKALDAWRHSWDLSKDETDPKAKQTADQAISEYARLSARLGRTEIMAAVLAEIGNRPMSGSPAEVISQVREALWVMQHHPDRSFRCGPWALFSILKSQKNPLAYSPALYHAGSSDKGFSLAQVQSLAKKLGLSYRIVKREPGMPIPVPSIVHWKLGHYAAIVSSADGKFRVQDPTFNYDSHVTQATLDEEASGYFLIPGTTIPTGYTEVASAVAKTVFGRGNEPIKNPDDTQHCDVSSGSDGCSSCGMAIYSVKMMLVSLTFDDTPLWYSPAVGPQVSFVTTYNQRDANQPALFNHSNLGNRWTFDWMSYIIDNPSDAGTGVKLYLRGGGAESYDAPDGAGNFPIQSRSSAILKRLSSTSYLRTMPNGSTETYDLSNGSTAYPRYVYLTKVTDPQGRSLQINYDSQYRVASIIDALGQATTLAYGLVSDPLKITQISDPFGRTASFTYDGNGHLASITDMIGITSRFTYDPATDDVTSLTTPYGVTTFKLHISTDGGNNRRWIDIVNPLAQQERVESIDIAPTVSSDSSSNVPSPLAGLADVNENLNYRNSFYWDRKTTVTYGTSDYTKARDYHFLHGPQDQESGILESTKAPLENRVWNVYKGQTDVTVEGPSDLLVQTARVLDDGTTQATYYDYNEQGNPTKTIDPVGRETDYVYASNGIDQIQVLQKTSSGSDVLSATTYNAAHQPLTITDAAGQTTTYTYTADMDVHTVTTPPTAAASSGETTTYAYDLAHIHQPSVITGAISGATTSYTYDDFNRIKTVADSEGYTLTYDYDALDRIVKIAYPDGTADLKTYNRLDLESETDRLGRTTTYVYDGIRQKAAMKDSLGRLTQFVWCYCGALQELIDPKGQRTKWAYDIEGRMLSKTYPDNSQTLYAYESTTKRVKSRTDALGQVTTYTYNSDDTLASVAYSSTVHTTPNIAYTYDSHYRRLTQTDDGIGTTTYAYGSVGFLGANRVVSISGPLSNSTVTYSYDGLSRVSGRNVNGTVESVQYDILNRPIQDTNALGTFHYSYVDQTSRLATTAYPNGQVTNYSYYGNTGDQRLREISNIASDSTVLSDFTYEYDPIGNIKHWVQTLSGESTQDVDYSYDKSNRLTAGTFRTPLTTLPTYYGYVYDAADNRIGEQQDLALRQSTTNNLNQLTGHAGGGPMQLKGAVSKPANVSINGKAAHFDSGNNFQGVVNLTGGTNTVSIVAVDGSGNSSTNNYSVVVPSTPAVTCSYDVVGNQTGDSTRNVTYEWDAENRLSAINYSDGGRTEMAYDALGNRVSIVEKNGGMSYNTRRFIYDGNSVAEEHDASNATTKQFFTQGMKVISGYDNPGNVYYTRDHLGSVREAVTDWGYFRWEYDPYGNITTLNQVVTGGGITFGDNPWYPDYAYAGMYLHDATGLYLTKFREYDSTAGKWLSRDPMGEKVDLNLYAYVKENPLRGMDPLGLKMVDTGVSTCYYPIHWYLRVGGVAYGLHPDSSIWGGPGSVANEDEYFPNDTAKESCSSVKLDDCKYDIAKFKSCVQSEAETAAAAPGSMYYCIFGSNCHNWVSSVISRCEAEARK